MRASTVKAVMSAIERDKISRAEAARRLGGISERHVNRLMTEHGVKRPPGKSRERRLVAQQRREAKQGAASAVLAKEKTLEQAARGVCSERTLYRWIERLKSQPKKKAKRLKIARKR